MVNLASSILLTDTCHLIDSGMKLREQVVSMRKNLLRILTMRRMEQVEREQMSALTTFPNHEENMQTREAQPQ